MKLSKSQIEDVLAKYDKQYQLYLHDLHNMPEPSLKEFKTTTYLAKALDNLNIEYTILSDKNGLFGELNFNQPKTIAFRADIDALPLEKGGYAHMCGHSTHAAALLSTLHVIVKEGIEVPFNLRFVFQPAEEIGAGAEITIDQKAYENIDYAVGVHNANFPINTVVIGSGALMSAAALSVINIYGPGGHSSFSNELPNPLTVLMEMLVKIEKEINAHDLKKVEASFAATQIDGSKKRNILAKKVTGQMYYHYYQEETFTMFKEVIDKHAHVEDPRLRIEVEHQVIIPAMFNRVPELIDFVSKKIEGTKLKADLVEDLCFPASDDFAQVINRYPGVHLFVGIEGDKKIGEYHSPEYNPYDGDPRSLWRFWTSLLTVDSPQIPLESI